MADDRIEISVRGQWVTVPAVPAQGRAVVFRGAWPRIAVIHDETWQEELEDPEAIVEVLKSQRTSGKRADIFTFTHSLPGLQLKYPFELESVAVVYTSSFQTWWDKLPQEARKNVRRAQKRGVTVSVQPFGDELIAGIMGVNDDSTIRQGRRNDHYGKSFAQVQKDQSAFLDRSEFLCAYHGNETIGFAKIVYKQEFACFLNFAVKASHHDKRPANLLIAEAVKRCEARGMTYLTYGMFNYGNKRDSPLREFKTRNGFEELLVPKFYVPLTMRGSLCLKAKLHRGVLGIVPHGVINFIVNVRSKWYKWYLSDSRQAGVAQ